MKIYKISQIQESFETELSLQNGKVVATVAINENALVILEFYSSTSGEGFGEKAMLEIKSQYGLPIFVQDPGEEGTRSRSFWDYMRNKGLVDQFIDPETFTEY